MLSTYEDFRQAADLIALDDTDPVVEVTEHLFRRICQDKKTKDYFTWGGENGTASITVYREGMRGTVEAREKLSAEAFRDAEISEMRKEKGLA